MPSPILKFFSYAHLPEGTLRDTSEPFCRMAVVIEQSLPDGAEKSTCLRKLLEAKDCAVRAVIP